MSSKNNTRTMPLRRALAACAVTAGMLFAIPAIAQAETLEELQQAVQEKTAAYDEATARVEELQEQISQNQARIAEIGDQLPGERERAGASIRVLYKIQQSSGGIIDLLLSAEDFNELITTIEYLDVIQSRNIENVEQLLALATELEETQAALDAEMTQAEVVRQEAEAALLEAQAARRRLDEQIAAQAAAEATERQAALDAARAATEGTSADSATTEGENSAENSGSSGTFTTESGQQAQIEVPSSPDPGVVEWPSEKDQFISQWTVRLDAYLAGSPLAGQGRTFAEAAWTYGVDPRFSAAISCVESGKGTYCFLPHNAWGWGSSSWSSWEQAIWDHTDGLASIYGGTLTYSGARMYCPPNADFWYARVLAEMEKI